MRILDVMWYDGKPFEVTCEGEHGYESFDVDFCLDGFGYYHCSGSWGSLRPDEPVFLDGLPEGVETLEDLIEHYDLEPSEVVHCRICKGCWPADAHCEHLVWSEEWGDWEGPGVDFKWRYYDHQVS